MPEKKQQTEIVTMPMIAMRGIVLFPNMILHFDVGRKKSIAALEEAMKGNREVFLASQINIEEDEIKLDNVNKVGVVAEIRQIIKNNGGTTRILVEGKYRASFARAQRRVLDKVHCKRRLTHTRPCGKDD